ncbi:MAG: aldo/keto reductase, partial [Acidobacteria bacterium]|nr:aldo/keto reductase [Acidobacteriota bacterium]
QARNIAVIARVPFDEGSLTGSLTRESSWPEEDWRNIYFRLENLEPTVERVEALHAVIPAGMDLSEVALRFVLQHPAVSTTIPGMRRPVHVRRNLEVSDGRCLSEATMRELGRHRWDRSLVIE